MAGRHESVLPAVAGQVIRDVHAALGQTKDICQFGCEQTGIDCGQLNISHYSQSSVRQATKRLPAPRKIIFAP